MKSKYLLLGGLLLCIFTFTTVASAFNTTTLGSLSEQLQGLISQLQSLLGTNAELTAATSVVPLMPRTCQVNFTTSINGVTTHASTTMIGAATDTFAIGLSISTTTTKNLMYSKQLQAGIWGTNVITTATAGYYTPIQYTNQQANLAALQGNAHYKILSLPLINTNNTNSSTTYSTANPYAEGRIENSAMPGIAASKIIVRVNVTNCVDPANILAQKPNIIFVLTDDLDMTLLSQLPKLKALMTDKGMTFENHFTSLSLCCPSRTATLCGQYAHNNGVFTNEADNGDGTSGAYKAFQQNQNGSKTMALWLKNAGYKTALMGKYLNGYSADAGVPYTIPLGWSEWAVPLDGNPYTEYNYTLNVNGAPEEHYLSNCVHGVGVKNCPLNLQTASVTEKTANYMINVLDKKAQDFITRSSAANTPFFLYLAPYAPHSPYTPAPRYAGLLTDPTWLAQHPFPKTASFDEADISDKPSWLKDNAGFLTSANILHLEDAYHRRIAAMYGVEDMLSNLIDTLTKTGELDNTYIIFTSDNGYHLGEHRLLGGKLTAFDTDLHIPLIIRGPKVPAASTAKLLTANVDIAPTIASLAGLEIPSTVDGRSFKATLLGGASSERKALLIEHANPPAPAQIVKLANKTAEPRDTDGPISGGEFVTEYRGLRTPVYTYVHYTKNSEEELYDNIKDPAQLVNIAKQVSPDLLTKLRTWTTDLSTCKGDTCRSIESEARLVVNYQSYRCLLGDKLVFPGGSTVAYRSSIPPQGSSCSAISQIRSCVGGMLSGDAAYASPTCSADSVNTNIPFAPKGEDTTIITQPDGSLLMMQAAEMASTTAFRGGRLWLQRSTDNGKTWHMTTGAQVVNYTNTDAVQYAVNGPMMLQTNPTRIVAVYHLWTNYATSSKAVHSIEAIVSLDNGVTWRPLSTVDSITIQKLTGKGVVQPLSTGLWEPFILEPKLQPGHMQVYYARERDQAEVCTGTAAGVNKGQDIAMKESTDFGRTWGPLRIILRNGWSREGVPTIAESPDGGLFLAHEHLRFPACADTRPQSGFLPSMAVSADGGLTWIDKGPAYYPPSNFVGSGWPHVIRLKDGRLALRFATEIVPGSSDYNPRNVNLLLTTNIPTRKIAPVWEKTPTVIMGTSGQWGTIHQMNDGNLIVTSGLLNYPQHYRVFSVGSLPALGF